MKSSVKSNEGIKNQITLVQEGIAAAKTGKKDIAEASLSHAVEQDPTNEIAWLWLAYISNDVDKTISFLRRALALNTENTQARNSLTKALLQRGIAYAKSGENLLARESLSEAASNNPKDEAAWLWLASVAENRAKMTSHLHKVLDLNPTNPRALAWLKSLTEPTEVAKAAIEPGGAEKEHSIDQPLPAVTAYHSPEEVVVLAPSIDLTPTVEDSALEPLAPQLALATLLVESSQPETPLQISESLMEDPVCETVLPEIRVALVEIDTLPSWRTTPETQIEIAMASPTEPILEIERVETAEPPAQSDDFDIRLTLLRNETLEMEDRWRRELEARLKAEEYAEELQAELYRSINLRREAESLNLKADVAIRDCELARADARKMQEQLRSVEETSQQEIIARKAAEMRIQQIEEDTDRLIQEKIAAIAGVGAADAIARDEALAKAREAEAWAQELSGKWQEEIATRESTQKRIAELEAELARTQNLLHQAELAWTKVAVRPVKDSENASEMASKIDRNPIETENHFSQLEDRLAETETQPQTERRNRLKAEARLRKSMEEKGISTLRTLARTEKAANHHDLFSGTAGDLIDANKKTDGESRFGSTLPGAIRFSDSEGFLHEKNGEFDPKATFKMVIFILIVSGSLFSLVYVTYTLLQNAQ